MSYLGLDLGGSSAKAAAFALDGSLLAAAKVPYVLESPRPGWRESTQPPSGRLLRTPSAL